MGEYKIEINYFFQYIFNCIMNISDIKTFFSTSLKKDNESTNKIREIILSNIKCIPIEFLEDKEYGDLWNKLIKEWDSQIVVISEGITYTSYKIKHKGGKQNNHDFIVSFYNDTILVKEEKIEFKYGSSSINKTPQVLSISSNDFPLGSIPYTEFYYENYLDEYIACDTMITEPKPLLKIYLREIKKYKVTHPFFIQIKNRNHYNKQEKYSIVKKSIREYLLHYSSLIDIPIFYEKIKSTQDKKIFILWNNGKFIVEKIDRYIEEESSSITFKSIENENMIELRSSNGIIYQLLLRWANTTGILNPTWKIGVKSL
jgi:hypothetical protein